MIKHNLLCIFLIAFVFSSCKTNIPSDKAENVQVDGHPEWIMQGNIYEVNVRQYTAEGTFNAFAKHLQRLKEMGVQTLWFMPINPISVKDRKGAMGSYYAIADYKKVNPEFGTLADWKNLVNKAHEMGFKVIIDWVPNHTGADHPWIKSNPAFYLKNAKGEPTHPLETDWTDIRKLEYKGTYMNQLTDSMTAAMKYWITETDIDGFRVDVAGEVGKEFYMKAIPALRKEKNIFLLAEAEQPWLHEVGFDASYGWNSFHMMKKIAKGERKAAALDSTVILAEQPFPATALRMFFTSNHDENSWNKADYETMPGNVHAPFAVLTQTLPKSIPLIYSGQEEPVLDSISFFYKDAIPFGKYQRASFYKALMHLRKRNAALAANAAFTKLNTGNDDNVYAFMRTNGGRKVLVITNLSAASQTFKINTPSVNGEAKNIFDNQTKQVKAGDEMELPAWGYVVWEYK